MKIHREFQQNSVQWLQARCGIPTASEFDSLVTPNFKIRTGDMPRSFLARKLAERWQGYPLPSFQSIDMDAGHILEDEAIPYLALEFGWNPEQVGFITTDDGKVGCSPDAILRASGSSEFNPEMDGGVEIKCPRADTHVRYLLNGELPEDYRAQVHGSMFVSGCHFWHFVSYRRGFPPFCLMVERDEKIQAVLADALATFNDTLESQMKRLEEINGGPPARPKAFTPEAQPDVTPYGD